jgi:hypothetical protein
VVFYQYLINEPCSFVTALHVVVRVVIVYVAIVVITVWPAAAQDSENAPVGALRRVGDVLVLVSKPFRMALYGMGRVIGYLGRSFVEGMKDGYGV